MSALVLKRKHDKVDIVFFHTTKKPKQLGIGP